MGCTRPVQAERADLPILAINRDLTVDKPVSYENKHLKIQGNVYLEKGGELTLTNCIVELMCRYTREFRYEWRGGILRTENVTIGGTVKDGNVEFTTFWIMDGEWHALDTTVQYSYGIMFSHKTIGKLRGKRFMKGPHPDGVIMNGKGDVILEDSSFNIALNYSIRDGGTLRFNLPVGETPMTRVFDQTTLGKGCEYRLEMRKSRVPGWWWLFLNDLSMDGPPCEVFIDGGGKVVSAVKGTDLRGTATWVRNLEAPFTFANLTMRKGDQPLRIDSISFYLHGDKTDVVVPGPTELAEVMLWGGKFTVRGTPGTKDAICRCVTFDFHGNSQVSIENAAFGIPMEWKNYPARGLLTVDNDARLVADNSTLRRLRIITRDKGSVRFDNSVQTEDVVSEQNGGPIEFLDVQKQ